MSALFNINSCTNCFSSHCRRFLQSKGFSPERIPRNWPESPVGVHWKSRNWALLGKSSVWNRGFWNGWVNSVFSSLFSFSCSQWKRIDDIVSMTYPPVARGAGDLLCWKNIWSRIIFIAGQCSGRPQKQDINWTLSLSFSSVANCFINPTQLRYWNQLLKLSFEYFRGLGAVISFCFPLVLYCGLPSLSK